MNTSKTFLIAGLGIGFTCAVGAVLLFLHEQPGVSPASPAVAPQEIVAKDTSPREAVLRGGARTEDASRPEATAIAASDASRVERSQPAIDAPPIAPAYKPGPSKFRKAKEPMARAALEFVGADPESDRLWLAAISDPTVPAEERKDLIEDLNEDGISDPKNPTRKDLGLIQGRIALIEQLLPSAMDEVNAAAFREAHKDLTKMNARLSGK